MREVRNFRTISETKKAGSNKTVFVRSFSFLLFLLSAFLLVLLRTRIVFAAGHNAENECPTESYADVIEQLTERYGSLRITSSDCYSYKDANGKEVEGLCYLKLLDFNMDGTEELLAICKNENECDYTAYIYTIENGSVRCIFQNDDFTSTLHVGDIWVQISYAPSYGYVIRSSNNTFDDSSSYIYAFDGNEIKPVISCCFRHTGRDEGFNAINNKEVTYDEFNRYMDDFWGNKTENAEDSSSMENNSGENYPESFQIDLRYDLHDKTDEEFLEPFRKSLKEVYRNLNLPLDNIEGESTGFTDAKGTEESENIKTIGIDLKIYERPVRQLEEKFGEIRVSRTLYTIEKDDDLREVNGVCHLQLIDFNNDGIKDLLAICKNEFEYSYWTYIYTISNGDAICVFKDDYKEFTYKNKNIISVNIANLEDGRNVIEAGNINQHTQYHYFYGFKNPDYGLMTGFYADDLHDSYTIDNEECTFDQWVNALEKWPYTNLKDSSNHNWHTTRHQIILCDDGTDIIDQKQLQTMVDECKKDISGK